MSDVPKKGLRTGSLQQSNPLPFHTYSTILGPRLAYILPRKFRNKYAMPLTMIFLQIPDDHILKYIYFAEMA
jgi:hypothetical protein